MLHSMVSLFSFGAVHLVVRILACFWLRLVRGDRQFCSQARTNSSRLHDVQYNVSNALSHGVLAISHVDLLLQACISCKGFFLLTHMICSSRINMLDCSSLHLSRNSHQNQPDPPEAFDFLFLFLGCFSGYSFQQSALRCPIFWQ